MSTLLIILGLSSAIASVMVWVELRSPEGYEDESGFHYGPEEQA